MLCRTATVNPKPFGGSEKPKWNHAYMNAIRCYPSCIDVVENDLPAIDGMAKPHKIAIWDVVMVKPAYLGTRPLPWFQHSGFSITGDHAYFEVQ